MRLALIAVLVAIPLAWHLGLVLVTYYDTQRVPLDRRKWTAIVALIPLFGFFMYLFERSELDYDPADDPYAGGRYNIHPSRANDATRTDDEETGSADGRRDGRSESSNRE